MTAQTLSAADRAGATGVDYAGWLSLLSLRGQYEANLSTLRRRDSQLAARLETISLDAFIRTRGDVVDIGIRSESGELVLQPNPLPAAAAAKVAAQLCPSDIYHQPLLVAGLDQGWLWLRLHQMPAATPVAPGHRPPLYLICSDPARLWIVLHVHDFRSLLLDPRVNLFAGADAIDQLIDHAIAHPQEPLPRLSVTVDPGVWPGSQSLDTMLARIAAAWDRRLNELRPQLQNIDDRFNPVEWAVKTQVNGSLRVLGITSRFTTFLQYSMRDWLDAFRAMGHDVHLLIESADHQQLHPLWIAETAARVQPDLILLIDHFRAEMTGLPQGIPTVMWVQDRLPNIFNGSAGRSQGATDYVIGQGRTDCVHQFGYPSSRFMPAMVGTNPRRFSQAAGQREIFCDVSFVSHCSQPANQIVSAEIARLNSPNGKRFLSTVFDQLRAVYDAGGCITQPFRIENIVRQTLLDTQTSVPEIQPVLDLFTHRINNALYRHQVIGWVAETGANLRLYGRGWETHPLFSRFACGVADNQTQLADIYRQSAINLQVTPFGAAHQRLFDGLAAGGFFLLRRTQGDRFDRELRQLWNWCVNHEVSSDAQLLAKSDESARHWIAQLDEIDNKPVIGRGYDFVSEMAVNAQEGFIRSAGTIWPEFDDVAFNTRDELQGKIRHFLNAPDDRKRLTQSMRGCVLEKLTYETMNKQMLEFIASDLSKSQRGAA